jgi:hypothetical protein
MRTRVKIVSAVGYRRHRAKLDESVAHFESALNHPLFEAAMRAFRASAKTPRMLRTEGLDQGEVLAELRRGWPRRKGRAAPVIGLRVELDPEVREGTIGCTVGGEIFTRPTWFLESPPSDMAGHLAHEYAHIIGFKHSRERTPRRHLTVPYAVGELISEVAMRIEQRRDAVTPRRVDALLRAVGAWTPSEEGGPEALARRAIAAARRIFARFG